MNSLFVYAFLITSIVSCDCCDVSQFQCKNGDCIAGTKLCDTNFDCTDSTDESNCMGVIKCVEGLIRCYGVGDCVDVNMCNESVYEMVSSSSLLVQQSLSSTVKPTLQVDESSLNKVSTMHASMPTTVFYETVENEVTTKKPAMSMATTYIMTESSYANINSSVLPSTIRYTSSAMMISTEIEHSSPISASGIINSPSLISLSAIEIFSSLPTVRLIEASIITPKVTEFYFVSFTVAETSQMLLSSVGEQSFVTFSTQFMQSVSVLYSRSMETSLQLFTWLADTESLFEPSSDRIRISSAEDSISTITASGLIGDLSNFSSTLVKSSFALISSSMKEDSSSSSQIKQSLSILSSNVKETYPTMLPSSEWSSTILLSSSFSSVHVDDTSSVIFSSGIPRYSIGLLSSYVDTFSSSVLPSNAMKISSVNFISNVIHESSFIPLTNIVESSTVASSNAMEKHFVLSTSHEIVESSTISSSYSTDFAFVSSPKTIDTSLITFKSSIPETSLSNTYNDSYVVSLNVIQISSELSFMEQLSSLPSSTESSVMSATEPYFMVSTTSINYGSSSIASSNVIRSSILSTSITMEISVKNPNVVEERYSISSSKYLESPGVSKELYSVKLTSSLFGETYSLHSSNVMESSVLSNAMKTHSVKPIPFIRLSNAVETSSIMISELSSSMTESVKMSTSLFVDSTTTTTTSEGGIIPIDINNEDIVIMIAVFATAVIIMIILSLVGWQLIGKRGTFDIRSRHRLINNNNEQQPPSPLLSCRNRLWMDLPRLDFVHAPRLLLSRRQTYKRLRDEELARHEEIQLRVNYLNGHPHDNASLY